MGIRTMVIALVVAAALTAAALSPAAESNETTTYGADGIARASLGPTYVETGITSVTPRADGGLVVQRIGQLETLLADGAPDPAAPPREVAHDRHVFPAGGGKSFVVEKEKLTRLNPDGTPDPSFGRAGTVKTQLYGAAKVLDLGTGKVAEFSASLIGARTQECLVQVTVLNPDGSVDTGAGFQTSLPLAQDLELNDVVPTPAGGALMVDESFLLELLPDGTLNTAFGTKGVTYAGKLASAHFLTDGSIEAVGQSYEKEAGQDLAVFRFTAAGAPDTAFAPGGIRRFDLGEQQRVNTASWAADGSVIVAGYEYKEPCLGGGKGCETTPTVAAVDAAGNLVTGFGEGGVLRLRALTSFSANYLPHGATALARRPDGTIVVGGNAPPEETVAFLAALTPGGQLIPSFGDAGVVRLRSALPAGQRLAGMAALPSGGVIAAASTEHNVEETAVLIRYAADGSLDPSFGGGSGYVVLGKGSIRSPAGFAVDGDEALTSLGAGPQARLLMNSTATGQPVSSFGDGGAAALPPEVIRPKAVAFTKAGDPVVLARLEKGGYEVLRYLPDGTLDPTFGKAGRSSLRLPGNEKVLGSSLAIGARGTIVVAGQAHGKFAVGILLADGKPDRHFGNSGWAVLNGGAPAESELAVPWRGGSQIYLAGSVEYGEQSHRIVVMRLDDHGRLQRGFGHKGRLEAFYPRAARPTVIAPGRDGVFVAVDIGPRPLLTFSHGGKVKRRAPGSKVEFVREVEGTVAGGNLFLAWSHPITRTLTETSYISKSPLHP